jgi:hypothetical protein
MPATDPTFYRSPGAAVAAAPEQLAYVAAFDPVGQANDALAVVDCDPNSSTYGGVVGWAEGGLVPDARFFPRGDDFRGQRVHQIRLQGGDASSDSYCYTS